MARIADYLLENLNDVYVKGDTTAAATRLRAAGMTVRAVGDGVVEGWVSPSATAAVAALGSAVPVIPGVLAGTTSEGDADHDGPVARAAGATGAFSEGGAWSGATASLPSAAIG